MKIRSISILKFHIPCCLDDPIVMVSVHDQHSRPPCAFATPGSYILIYSSSSQLLVTHYLLSIDSLFLQRRLDCSSAATYSFVHSLFHPLQPQSLISNYTMLFSESTLVSLSILALLSSTYSIPTSRYFPITRSCGTPDPSQNLSSTHEWLRIHEPE